MCIRDREETVPKVKGAADVEIVGLMVSLNRMEAVSYTHLILMLLTK